MVGAQGECRWQRRPVGTGGKWWVPKLNGGRQKKMVGGMVDVEAKWWVGGGGKWWGAKASGECQR